MVYALHIYSIWIYYEIYDSLFVVCFRGKIFQSFLKKLVAIISGKKIQPSAKEYLQSLTAVLSFQSSKRGWLKSIDHYDLTVFLMRKSLHHNEN